MGEQPLTGGNPGPRDAADTAGAAATVGGYRLQGLLGFSAVGAVHLAVPLEGPTGALGAVASDTVRSGGVASDTVTVVSDTVGSGAVGSDTVGSNTVVLTVVRAELAADGGFRERLRLDLEAARRVRGPRAVPVVGADPDGVPVWFASEYVPGPSLAQALAQHGPMPTDGAWTLLEDVAAGLEAVHAAGLPHLALDPASVLLAPSGPRVTGFGVARALEASTLSRRGVIARPPLFMAPEQIADRDASPRADLFALGHLAAFALLGRSPFGSGDPIALAHRIVHESPDLSSLPEPVRTIIERCLARDPEQRPTPAQVVEFCRVGRSGAVLPPTSVPRASVGQTAALPALSRAPQAQPPAPPQIAAGPRVARNPRWPFGIVGTALLSAAAVVAVVIGAVFAGRSSATADTAAQHPVIKPTVQHSAAPKPSPRPASPSPSPTPLIDPCLVGSWTGLSDDLVNHIDGNPVTFVSKGPNTTFLVNGTMTVDYGSGTTYSASYQGHDWKTVFKGAATTHAMTRDGLLYVSNVSANGSWVLTEDGSTNNSGALSVNMTPGPYTCSATTLVEYTPDGSDTETFTRIG